MSRIGIDIRNIGKKRTGDEVVFFNLTKNLAKIDKDNYYMLFTDITEQKTLERVKKSLNLINKLNFELISLPAKNRFIWNFWTLPRYLRSHSLDIYLTQYITPFFVPKKIKIITIIHDVSFKVYKRFIKKSDLFFLSFLIPLSFRRADKIVAVSQFTRQEIIKYYSIKEEKVEWIHNAVSEEFLTSVINQENKIKIKEKYQLPEKFILYLGTLQPRKNIPTLIKAYEIVRRKNPDVKLVLAGGKGHNYDQSIERMIAKYSLEQEIIFPGYIAEEDKPVLMSLAEIFCLPSFYEGFGIPILEAFSAEVPVVASNISPHQEIATGAAFFFEPSSSEQLAEELDKLLVDKKLRQFLVKKGKEQLKKFSWEKTTERVREIFKEVST